MIDRIADLFRALTDLSRDLLKYWVDPEVIEHRRKEKEKESWDRYYQDTMRKKKEEKWGK